MPIMIKNFNTLVANARSRKDRAARKLALMCLEAALQAADPRKIMKSVLKMKNSRLQVKERFYDLSGYRRIFVLGGGKATGSMAVFLEHLLGKRITDGYVNVLRGTRTRYATERIKLNEASHPIPDEAGRRGVGRMLKMLQGVTDEDLVICLLSGGASALMPYPIHQVSLRDKQLTTQIMLRSGSTINELNCVRKHLSLAKGGGLARAAFPARVLTLILSDVVGDPLDMIASGPTSPDPTTFTSAISVLKDRKVWRKVPRSVREVLREGVAGKIVETPKEGDEVFRNVSNVIIANNRTACRGAQEYARKTGVSSIILTSQLEGEAKDVGTIVSAIARELRMNRGGLRNNMVMVMGGETTVTVTGNGRGGRNQEMVLSASLKLKNCDGISIASIGTDGLDGNTTAAGAIIDSSTLSRAENINLKPSQLLHNNDSYRFFTKLHDTIMTGPTGTNLNDIIITAVVR